MNAPASVFEHDGSQYVVAYSAGNLFAGSAKGDSVWLFALDGTLDPVPAASELMTLTEAATGEADLANGMAVYAASCTFCHGENGEAGHGGGPALTGIESVGRIIQVINEGGGEMPPLGGSLSPEQIRDVSAYVLELGQRAQAGAE
jgi:alcohol dehydrogenase (cytochrome c)